MKNYKKVLSLLMVCVLLGLTFGCGSGQEPKRPTRDAAEGIVTKAPSNETKAEPATKATEAPTKATEAPTKATETPTKPTEAPTKATEAPTEPPTEPSGETEIKGAKYVMIYNPFIFDERDEAANYRLMRNTGKIGSQIVLGMNRADDMGDITFPEMVSPGDLDSDLDDMEYEAGGRAGGLAPDYQKGDVHAFYAFDNERMNSRSLHELTCIYAGEHCCIWDLNGAVTSKQAKDLGQEVDEKIYPADTKAFGQGRFTEDGGKVHILFQPLREHLGGFFCTYDIYATGEVYDYEVSFYGLNLDHAIININSSMLKTDYDFIRSTLAHEFQHQICATDFVESNKKKMRTWLNEAMSAYAEDLVYPGIKNENYYHLCMFRSDLFRKGQSLYNFDTSGDNFIGAYGAVYLFTRYLTDLAGDDVFSKVHENFRNGKGSYISEAEVLYKSVPKKKREAIESAYTYPKFIENEFENETDEWMSKMTLDFFLETIRMDLGASKSYGLTAKESWDIAHTQMLYSEINPQDIEGGGRMIVAVEGDTFKIPEDAQEGLIYIGLDENFNPVTGLLTNGK